MFRLFVVLGAKIEKSFYIYSLLHEKNAKGLRSVISLLAKKAIFYLNIKYSVYFVAPPRAM